MRVLAIESSCDETGIAIYDTKLGLMSHLLYSQIKLHAQYGGVVPELASRDHVRVVLPLIDQALQETKLSSKDIDAIVYTAGPGLIGALMVGATTASSIAMAWGKPCFGINHMEGHLLAPMLEETTPTFPYIALLVSGGHTMLIDVKGFGRYELMGESLDDAVGEAFDKTAKVLGLGYPGGPQLANLATLGQANKYPFPIPMKHKEGFDFSFSGLKTHVVNLIRKIEKEEGLITDQIRADIAKCFEEATTDSLVRQTQKALKAKGYKTCVIAGGVGANLCLRRKLTALPDIQLYYPRFEFCTDNGAMIAYVGAKRLESGEKGSLHIQLRPRWPMSELLPF